MTSTIIYEVHISPMKYDKYIESVLMDCARSFELLKCSNFEEERAILLQEQDLLSVC